MIAHDESALERAELDALERSFPALQKKCDDAKSAFALAIAAVEENASARARLRNAIADREREARAEAERAKKAEAESAYPTTRAGFLTDEALERALGAIRGAAYVGEPGSCPFLHWDFSIVAADEFVILAIYAHVVKGGPLGAIHGKIRELEDAGTPTATEARNATEKRLFREKYGG